jgi:hypothetical protein
MKVSYYIAQSTAPHVVPSPPVGPVIDLQLIVVIAGLVGSIGGAIIALVGFSMQYARKDEKTAFAIQQLKVELLHQRELDNQTHASELSNLKTEIKAYFQRRDDNTASLRNDLAEVRHNLQGLGMVVVRDTDVKWTWRRYDDELSR